MEYTCELILPTPNNTWRKKITLPFVPIKGMSLSNFTKHVECQEIEDVDWDCVEKEFMVIFEMLHVSDVGFSEDGWEIN